MYVIKVELVNDTNMFKMCHKSADGHAYSNVLFAKVVKSSNSLSEECQWPKMLIPEKPYRATDDRHLHGAILIRGKVTTLWTNIQNSQ